MKCLFYKEALSNTLSNISTSLYEIWLNSNQTKPAVLNIYMYFLLKKPMKDPNAERFFVFY